MEQAAGVGADLAVDTVAEIEGVRRFPWTGIALWLIVALLVASMAVTVRAPISR